MTSIGIVGAGVSALHLGLRLRQHDIPVRIYTDRPLEEVARGRLLNTAAHHHPTLLRERQLGVHHWDAERYGYRWHHCSIDGPQPVIFRGDLRHPSSVIDYRLYLPRLMADFQDRGGRIEIRPIGPADLEPISNPHDLLVVAAGAGRLAARFPRRADRCPFDRPQRRLCAALYRGIAPSEPKGVTIHIWPGHGELIEVPIYSFDGHGTALVFEAIPGGDLEILAGLPYAEDPGGFQRTVLDVIRQHFPLAWERVDPSGFGVTRPEDLLQGALTPTVRQDAIQLENGKYAIAVGDAHTLVDPITAQGANSASYSAWTLGDAILEDVGFDDLFCRRVACQRADIVESVSNWTNLMLTPPAPHLVAMFISMALDQQIADEFTINFGYPDRQWSILATPQRTRRYLERHGFDLDELLAGGPNAGPVAVEMAVP